MPSVSEIAAIIGKFSDLGSLGGGDIASIRRLRSAAGDFVLKTGENFPPGLFASEAHGLELLSAAGASVPEIIACEESFLLMRYIEPGPSRPAVAGEILARIHCQHGTLYGHSRNTYLATLIQDNKPTPDWADFFLYRRLLPLVENLAVSNSERDRWIAFGDEIRPLLAACPQPSLIHGDLWSGNLYYGKSGPVLIDPACYYADALVDIAMTKLFGGFGVEFYTAYHSILPVRAEEEALIAVYKLYPLLVHAHLFGGGYYASACAIRDRFATS